MDRGMGEKEKDRDDSEELEKHSETGDLCQGDMGH